MEKILNDNYDDKYTRATIVYAQATETARTYTASLDAAGEQPINSADLYEFALKGLIINGPVGNTSLFPVGVTKANGAHPTVVAFFVDGSVATLMAVDPEV